MNLKKSNFMSLPWMTLYIALFLLMFAFIRNFKGDGDVLIWILWVALSITNNIIGIIASKKQGEKVLVSYHILSIPFTIMFTSFF